MRTERRKTKWFIGCAEVFANNEWKWANNKVVATFSVLLAKALITHAPYSVGFVIATFYPRHPLLYATTATDGVDSRSPACVIRMPIVCSRKQITTERNGRLSNWLHLAYGSSSFSVAPRLIAWSAHMSALDIMLKLIRKRRCHSCRGKWTLNAIRNLLSHGISILLASSICAPLKFLHAQKINISRVGVAVAVAAID